MRQVRQEIQRMRQARQGIQRMRKTQEYLATQEYLYLDLDGGSCATELPSTKRILTASASIAAGNVAPDGTATEHVTISANAKGSASADDTPLETVSPEPDLSCSMEFSPHCVTSGL